LRRILAALVLAGALTAHAQTPPESPAAPAPAAPAPDQSSDSAAQPGVMTQEQAERPAPHPAPALRAPVARPQSAPPPAPAAAPPHPASENDQQLRDLRAQVSGTQPSRGAWGSLAVAAVLALALGFALGWRVLDRRIRRRYGGLRIY
jgi:hypothetical protein